LKLLIHTQYFPPEIGAPQNRLFELAVRLNRMGIEVTVLTAMPNYPSMEIQEGYQGKKYFFEEMEGLSVHRSSIYVSKSKSIFKRLINYFSFVWSSYWFGKNKLEASFDFILCESPPLFLGISSYLLAKKKGAKFIFNVSDLWPESAEKLGLVTNPFFLKLATLLEEYMYKKADLISGQTMGIVNNIKERFPAKKVYWLPNGVDISYYKLGGIKEDWRKEKGFMESDKLILYAGIIGHAQGLEIILNAAKRLQSNSNLKFLLLGSGPCKSELKELAIKLDLNNLFFYDAVSKNEMPSILNSVDIAIVPLKKLDLFKGAIPSKIFETLAMQVPIILGVEGEAKKLFIDEANAGLFYEPENELELSNQILKLVENESLMKELGSNGVKYVSEKFNRDTIAESLYKEINIL
jgi:glycosyltransferase involved in cell wall biosynthesis